MGKNRRNTIRNEQTYMMYLNRLTNLALSLFKWEGLPESVDERFLELTMLQNGNAVFFKADKMGYMVLPVAPVGKMNVYHNPVAFTAYSIGFSQRLTDQEGVIIWNNYSRTPTWPTVEQYAERLYYATRAIDVNLEQQKFPFFIQTDEAQRLTMENAMRQHAGNEPFIFGNKGFDPKSIQAIITNVPYNIDKLTLYKHDLWNEAMSYLGIGNANQDKKERLVQDEVAANDEQIQGSREVMLQARRDACDKINSMFGLKVSVDFKFNIDDDIQNDEGGTGNEE